MSTITLEGFLDDRNLLAVKVSSSNLQGLFRKSLTLPLHTAGLARYADGSERLIDEGGEVSGKFDLVLAKKGEFRVGMVIRDLASADGFPFAGTVWATFELALEKIEYFRDFCRVCFNYPGTYSGSDLKNTLAVELRRLFADHCQPRPAAELHEAELSGTLGRALADGLERHLFDAGVRFRQFLELSLRSNPWERRAADEKRRADEVFRSAQAMDRKEERLRRLAGILKDQEVQGLLTKVPDERLKGLLYAKLMEDDAVQITAEELLSKAKDCGEEVVQVIYKAMENLLSTGASVSADEVESARAERIFAAAGSKVLEIDPASGERRKVHVFRDPLRSVRTVETPQGALLVGGGKRAVSALSLSDGSIREYPLPPREVKGGVNSVAVLGDRLYATHSEHGLLAWSLAEPGAPAELLHAGITRPHRTTRAVQADAQGALLFASGSHVYAARAGGGEVVKYVSSVESPVSCVAAAARTLFAGTESGSILCWKSDAPDQPVVLVRKRDPIVNLRLAKICGIPHLLYSAKDLSVRARVLGQNLETSYESEGRSVGILDAASDLICASDGDGRRVLVWKTTAPARPEREIEVWREAGKPVLDLWMKKGRPRSA
jgi:hypothetical protein